MKIKELFKNISVPQVWAVVIAIVTTIGGIYTFGYKQGYRDHEIKICYEIIKLKDKENLELTNEKQDLKNEVARFKTIIFALKSEKRKIQPILQYLIDEYERELKEKNED